MFWLDNSKNLSFVHLFKEWINNTYYVLIREQ